MLPSAAWFCWCDRQPRSASNLNPRNLSLPVRSLVRTSILDLDSPAASDWLHGVKTLPTQKSAARRTRFALSIAASPLSTAVGRERSGLSKTRGRCSQHTTEYRVRDATKCHKETCTRQAHNQSTSHHVRCVFGVKSTPRTRPRESSTFRRTSPSPSISQDLSPQSSFRMLLCCPNPARTEMMMCFPATELLAGVV